MKEATELAAGPSDFDQDGALTRAFLLRRGSCCGNDCRHCPYRAPTPNEPKIALH